MHSALNPWDGFPEVLLLNQIVSLFLWLLIAKIFSKRPRKMAIPRFQAKGPMLVKLQTIRQMLKAHLCSLGLLLLLLFCFNLTSSV